MAVEYMIKIKPALDEATAKDMENRLGRRFDNMGRRFAHGLKKSLRFAMTGGIIGSVLNQVLAPLEAIDAKINETLVKAGSINSKAAQFGGSAAQYMQLQSAAAAKGVDEGTLITMMTRVQAQLNEARAAKARGESHALEGFTDETNDMAAFEKIMTAIQEQSGGDPQKFAALWEQILGSKMGGKASEFLRTNKAGQKELIAETLERRTAEEMNAVAVKNEKLANKQAVLQTRSDNRDYFNTSGHLNEGIITQQADARDQRAKMLSDKIPMYNELSKMQTTIEKLSNQIEKILTKTMPLLDSILDLLNQILTPLLDVAIGPAIKTIADGISKIVQFFFGKEGETTRAKSLKTNKQETQQVAEEVKKGKTKKAEALDYGTHNSDEDSEATTWNGV